MFNRVSDYHVIPQMDDTTSHVDSARTRLESTSRGLSGRLESRDEGSEAESRKNSIDLEDSNACRRRILRADTEARMKQAIEEIQRAEGVKHQQALRLRLLESILKNKVDTTNRLENSGRGIDDVRPDEGSSVTSTESERPEQPCPGYQEWICSQHIDRINGILKSRMEHTSEYEDDSESSHQELDKVFREMRLAVRGMPISDECSAIFGNYIPGNLTLLLTDFSKQVLDVFAEENIPIESVCKDDTPELDDARTRAARRLKPLFGKCLIILHVGFEHFPECCAELLSDRTEDGHSEAIAKAEEIVRHLYLRQEQRERLRDLRDEFISQQTKRLEVIARHYWEMEKQFDLQEEQGDQAGLSRSERYLQFFDASGEFVANSSQKQQLMKVVYFVRSIGDTLNFFQECTVLGMSYPDLFDMVSIAQVV